MIREIKNEVREAICEAFSCALHRNSGSFVLFLARGDYDRHFVGNQFASLDPKPSPYCLDYMLDAYKDETRDQFYIRYLNRRYKHDDFKYLGDEGILNPGRTLHVKVVCFVPPNLLFNHNTTAILQIIYYMLILFHFNTSIL